MRIDIIEETRRIEYPAELYLTIPQGIRPVLAREWLAHKVKICHARLWIDGRRGND